LKTRTPIAGWTIGLLAGCGVLSCNHPTLIVENSLIRDNKDTALVGYVHRKSMFPFMQELKGVPVEFAVDRRDFGRAQTDSEGKAELSVALPDAGATVITARAKIDDQDLGASAKAFHWRPERVILVVDIDHTISRSDVRNALFKLKERTLRPVEGARETLTTLAERFELLYLTARPRRTLETTRKWLQENGFPQGPVFTAPDVSSSLQAADFKQDLISGLQKDWPNILIGIGDRASDAEAYDNCGMLTILVRTAAGESSDSRAILMPSWYNLSRFFDANQKELADGVALRDILDGRKMLRLPLSAVHERPPSKSIEPPTPE
jgi:phosphoglycolate phosphatase-like HAD superfamily hydrolase